MKVLLVLAMLLVGNAAASACGVCQIAGLNSWVCVSSEYDTWCVSVCQGGSCSCTHGVGCGGGCCTEGGIVVEGEGAPPPSPQTALFRGLSEVQARALCEVTPGCTMISSIGVSGSAQKVTRGPKVTWGQVKRRYYR